MKIPMTRRIFAFAAATMLSVTAFAGRWWVAADGSDAKWSNTANWATGKDGASGASEPNAAESTGTIYFCKYKNGAAVFDKLGEGPGNVLFGTQDSRYFVWSATDPTYGLDATGKEFHLCENIGNGDRTPANLQVDSGTYKFGRVYFPNLANGESELLVKGGTITTTETSDTGVFRLCATQAGTTGTTTGTLTIDGGIFDCSSGGYMRVGGLSNVVATIHVKSGELKTRGMILGGSAGHKEICQVDNSISRMILDGGALTISHEGAIGCSVGYGTSSEMIVNAGATVNCNYGYFYVAEAGPGTLTMNGGTFTMQDSSDGGLSFGRSKNGNDVGTLVLNGGVLTTSKIRLNYVQPGSKIVFNGGTFKPTRTTSSFLEENANLTCEVQEGGLVVDTAGMDVGIRHSLTGSGPLIKKGSGTLTVSDATPFTSVIVYGGTAVVGGTTYGVNAEAAIDASAGGDLGEVIVHREKLEGWLNDSDFRNVSKYDAAGVAMMEQPEPVVIDVNGNRKTYVNLETGKTYNDEISGTAFSFTVEDHAPRTLQVIAPDNDHVENVRDVGSWPLLGGARMNQGVILRGGHLDHFVNATAEQRTASYLTSFGLKTEIELRGAAWDLPGDYKDSNNEITVTDSFAADGCAYVYCGLGYGDDAGTQIRAYDNGNFTNQIRKVFATWGTPGNLPSYFHCRIGTDRTGIVGLLLLGMMGVEEEVLYRDYLMSNFANIGGSRNTDVPDTFIRYLLRGNCSDGRYVYDTKDAQYGESIASRARQYLEMCGVTEEQLDVIAEALSGETADEVLARVNAYEQANNVRTVTYYPYEGNGTVMGVHRLPAGAHMLPTATPTRDGYVFRGWDTANEVNGVVYALWEAESELPRTVKWDNGGGDYRLANDANWYLADTDPHERTAAPTIIDSVKVENDDARLAVLNEGETFSAKDLYVGRGWNSTSPAVVDVTNGTFTVDGTVNLGQYGGSGELNVFGGDVTMRQILVGHWGSHIYNKFNIYGGNVAIQGGSWPGAVSIGNQADDTLGVMTITDGTVSIGGADGNNSLIVGYSNLKTPGPDLCNKLFVSGGSTTVSGGSIYVAHAAGAGGYLSVSGGTLSASSNLIVGNAANSWGRAVISGGAVSAGGDMNIASETNSWGQVDITGGSVTVAGTVRVGNHAYAQHAALNIAGGTLTAGTVSVARQCDAWVYITDGGTLYAEKMEKVQGAPETAHPHYYFDDATIVTTAAYDYNLASAASITVGAGGLTIDSNGFNSKIQAYPSIDGVGGLTKKGAGTIEFVANSFGFAGTFNLHGMIVVEAGTLKLPASQTIYCAGTQVADGATLDLNGSTIIVVTKKVVDSVWTDSSGDGNPANPVNWRSTIKYFDEYGAEVVALTESLDGVLPTADTEVRIPLVGTHPDLSGMTVKGAALYGSGDTPQILRGIVQVPEVVNDAVCWFDFDDASTVTIQDGSDVNIASIANKGTAKDTIPSAVVYGSDEAREPRYGDNGLNGRKIMLQTDINEVDGQKSKGLRTEALGLEGDQDRAIVVVCRRGSMLPNFALGIENAMWDVADGHFRIRRHEWDSQCEYCSDTWNDETQAYTSSARGLDIGQDPSGWVVRMFQSEKQPEDDCLLTSRAYSESSGETIRTTLATNLNTKATARLYMGYRYLYNSPSCGQIAEAFYFDRALTAAEQEALQSYLSVKWFTPADASNIPSDVLLENNALLDFGGGDWTFGTVKGTGTLGTANVTITGSISAGVTVGGNLDFANGAKIDCSIYNDTAVGTEIVFLTAAKITNWPSKATSEKRVSTLRLVENQDGTVSLVGTLASVGYTIRIR